MTSLVMRKVKSGRKMRLVRVGPKVIREGLVKLEPVQVICPACGQQVEAVATDGQVKGYCAIAKQDVDFLIETQGVHIGKHFTAEIRAKISATTKKLWQNPEYRAKQSVTLKEKWQDPEYRAKQSTALSAALKEKWQDPEYRAKQSTALSTAQKKKWQTPEYRAKQSTARKKKWQTPEYRAKQSAARIGTHHTTETKAKISASLTSNK